VLAVGVAALVAAPRAVVAGHRRCQRGVDRGEGAGQALAAAPVDHAERDARLGQQPAQLRIHRCAHLGALALQPVGCPGQVEPGQQGGPVAALPLEAVAKQFAILEQHAAVKGDHERRGVGQDDLGACRRGVDAPLLLPRDGQLLLGSRRAALAGAPFAQHLGDELRAMAQRAEMRGQLAAQLALAGAFGADQRDAARRLTWRSGRRSHWA
jgi:hypothetical protein